MTRSPDDPIADYLSTSNASSTLLGKRHASAAKACASASLAPGSSARLRRLQALGRPPSPTGDFVEGLWSDVRPVRPYYRPAVNEEALKVPRGPEGFEHRALKPGLEVDRVFGRVAENDVNPKTAAVLGVNDGWQESHDLSSRRGSILSRGRPAFIFSQFASSSGRCCSAHTRIRSRAFRDRISPAMSAPLKSTSPAERRTRHGSGQARVPCRTFGSRFQRTPR